MKEGLSGSIVNEIDDDFKEMQAQAQKLLSKLRSAERINPKKYIRTDIGNFTEGFTALASRIMDNRSKEKHKKTK